MKKAYEAKDVEASTPALDSINDAWKNASEEMYKAQADQGDAAEPQADAGAQSGETNDEDVEDVDFEEVK